jgi:hypothetical protein
VTKPRHAMTPVDAARCEGVTLHAYSTSGGRVRVDARRPIASGRAEMWGWYVSHVEATVLADALESVGKPAEEMRKAARAAESLFAAMEAWANSDANERHAAGDQLAAALQHAQESQP